MLESVGGELWAIVLAAGEGARLAPFVEELCGRRIPKQFATLTGDRSLLQSTMARIAALVPARRTVLVVSEECEFLARRQLAEFEGAEIVAQPRNIGTGPGLLLPLARVRARDRHARVAVFPSDHHVPEPEPLLRAVLAAAKETNPPSDRITLVGAEAVAPETEYGWILPDRKGTSTATPRRMAVRQFLEKPGTEAARQLMRDGALWNTFVSAGRLSAYWQLAHAHLPKQTAQFEAYLDHIGQADECAFQRSLYSRMEPADFSRAVLERASNLSVVSVSGSGWTDWGTPARVLSSLGVDSVETLRRQTRPVPARGGVDPAPPTWDRVLRDGSRAVVLTPD